jgi:hypothetical protein
VSPGRWILCLRTLESAQNRKEVLLNVTYWCSLKKVNYLVFIGEVSTYETAHAAIDSSALPKNRRELLEKTYPYILLWLSLATTKLPGQA